MPGAFGIAFGEAAGGALQSFGTMRQLGFVKEQLELQKRKQGLDTIKTLGEIIDAPAALRGHLFSMYMRSQGKDPSSPEIKEFAQLLGKIDDTQTEFVKNALISFGMENPSDAQVRMLSLLKDPSKIASVASEMGKLGRERKLQDIFSAELGGQGMPSEAPALHAPPLVAQPIPNMAEIELRGGGPIAPPLAPQPRPAGGVPTEPAGEGTLRAQRDQLLTRHDLAIAHGDSARAGAIEKRIARLDEMIGGGKPKATDESALRGQFIAGSKDFVTVRDAYGRVQAASENPSAAGDLALLFAFMKMTDPNSVVRESEFANAASSAGIPDRILAFRNRVLAGERLAPNTRRDFVSQANAIFRKQLHSQIGLERQFAGIAERNRFDPANIIVDYVGELRGPRGGPAPATPPSPASAPGARPSSLKGQRTNHPDGTYQNPQTGETFTVRGGVIQ